MNHSGQDNMPPHFPHEGDLPQTKDEARRTHLFQTLTFAAIVVGGLGVPLLIWGSGVNSSINALVLRADRSDHDVVELRTFQTQVIDRVAKANDTLTDMKAHFDDLRESLRGEKKR